ncbi:MAG TPA: glycoside hydrolase family 43 protein, partial [Candidatus Goldiibacteriota bacterium]|nr:glycoside hydrolase family 43 protein [Candidatus Goldiibacteriota bacterium]
MKYINPVIPGFYPDPSICRSGRDYYLVTSSFEYFPGVPVFHSRDLVHWEQIGHVLDRKSQLPLENAQCYSGIYAPTIRFHEGVFYMTTTNTSGIGNFIVSAENPAGPWSEPLRVAQEGIDPSLFFDADGSVYYTTANGGAFQSKIDIKTGKILAEPKLIWKGTGGRYPEAPHLYFINGWYYLMLAEGGTGYEHMVTMARSKSPWGPFEPCPRNPILTHRSLPGVIRATGHADLVSDGKNWFAVFLGVRTFGYDDTHNLGRETFLCPVKWHEDGFPVFGNDGTVSEEMEIPLEPSPVEPGKIRDDFDCEKKAFCWNFLRNPDEALYSLKERPGFMRLKGSKHTLNDTASATWLGRRQCHHKLKVMTCLEFVPESASEEAGLCVRKNEQHHHEIFLTVREGKTCVVMRQRIANLQAETACVPYDISAQKRCVLAIEADLNDYVFMYGSSEKGLKPIGKAPVRYLSSEIAGGFTGVYFA